MLSLYRPAFAGPVDRDSPVYYISPSPIVFGFRLKPHKNSSRMTRVFSWGQDDLYILKEISRSGQRVHRDQVGKLYFDICCDLRRLIHLSVTFIVDSPNVRGIFSHCRTRPSI